MRKRNEIGGDGFSKIGKLFYSHVHDALNAIKSNKWKPLWIEFWKTEGEKYIEKKKKAGRVWQSIVPGTDVDECNLFDSEEEEEEEMFAGYTDN